LAAALFGAGLAVWVAGAVKVQEATVQVRAVLLCVCGGGGGGARRSRKRVPCACAVTQPSGTAVCLPHAWHPKTHKRTQKHTHTHTHTNHHNNNMTGRGGD
jgi:hypothetical protein